MHSQEPNGRANRADDKKRTGHDPLLEEADVDLLQRPLQRLQGLRQLPGEGRHGRRRCVSGGFLQRILRAADGLHVHGRRDREHVRRHAGLGRIEGAPLRVRWPDYWRCVRARYRAVMRARGVKRAFTEESRRDLVDKQNVRIEKLGQVFPAG